MNPRHRLAIAGGVLLLLAGLPDGAAAQAVGSVTGIVTEQQSGRPMEGVQVFIPELERGSLTQPNGRYFLVNVPVGTYTVQASMIGFATVRHQNVVVATDITRQVNFGMVPEAVAVEEIVVTADRVPIVELNAAGSQVTVTADEIASLPVTTITGALSLQQGFLEVPDNTDVLSLGEVRRNVLSPIRIRGGRGGETMNLIDGIPVNNWVLGGGSIEVNPMVVSQVDLLRGGLEPQYGNALSGVVNYTTREGGERAAGALEYRTSEAGGALGIDSDELRNYGLLQGFLAGPAPFVPDNKLRYVIAARQESGADAVYEFDDDVFSASDPGSREANPLDLFPGWRAMGFDNSHDVFGKLTYYFSPSVKASFSVLDYRRERQPFDFRYLLTYDDPLSSPVVRTAEDSAAYLGNRIGLLGVPMRYQDVVKNTARLDRRLYVGSYNHTLSRGFFRFAVGRYDQSRLTCNWFQGVCLEDRFQENNFTTDRFVAAAPAGKLAEHPAAGSDQVYGGEDLTSYVARGDVQWQATDHHNLQTGLFYQRHDISYVEAENLNINTVWPIYDEFSVEPWDAAAYIQDRIEYDFISLSLGFRFDYGHAPGLFFRNPLDPTNGTTAGDVICNPGAWQSRSVRNFDAETGKPVTETMSAEAGWSALCIDPVTRTINTTDDPDAVKNAMLIASSDDLGEAEKRTQFSPRLRVSFPVTETASLFFNFGRYSQNPSIRNLYSHTGIGTDFEGIPYRVAQNAGVVHQQYRGFRTFDPSASTTATFVGNSNLLTERTTAYEVGWVSELGDDYGVSLTLFAKDQSGLTGIRSGGTLEDGTRIFDVGATYGTAQPNFSILVNSDYQTVRGFDVQLRRRLAEHWGFDVNYSYSQTRTNARALERAVESFSRENETRQQIEIISEIDQPHVFNAAVRFAVAEDTPDIPLGSLLRNGLLSLTLRAASGLPYTPTLGLRGGTSAAVASVERLDLNSGRSPTTLQVNLNASKDFRVGAMKYGLFATVTNLFDRRNCVQVFPTTGRCESGVIDQSRAALGYSNTQSDISLFTTTTFDHPEFVGTRRQVTAGVRASF